LKGVLTGCISLRDFDLKLDFDCFARGNRRCGGAKITFEFAVKRIDGVREDFAVSQAVEQKETEDNGFAGLTVQLYIGSPQPQSWQCAVSVAGQRASSITPRHPA
jgi:hypothetical protein